MEHIQDSLGEYDVDASPTKKLFVFMLVKDIELIDAVKDLIDNCVDGAKRSQGPNGPFTDLEVRVQFSAESFEIRDNCGGMSIDIAKNYAFRFGRPDDADKVLHTPNSVGQFGVGMKRAIFKLGRKFTVDSTTDNEKFEIEVDVDEWLKVASWQFHFSHLDKGDYSEEPAGVNIVVERLQEEVAAAFAGEMFGQRLHREIANSHRDPLQQGLSIFVNGVSVPAHASSLLASERMRPFFQKTELGKGQPKVFLRVYAGIGAIKNPRESGWYIFCNGRMVIEADQTDVTGWATDEGTRVPRWHSQFRRFQGFVYFDCEDASRLPWNTTKTSVDLDSPIYREARSIMIEAMREIIDFLNVLDQEIDNENPDLPDLVESARPVSLTTITEPSRFVYERSDEVAKPSVVRISYKADKETFDKVKDSLDVKSAKEVGEGTFEYYCQYALED